MLPDSTQVDFVDSVWIRLRRETLNRANATRKDARLHAKLLPSTNDNELMSDEPESVKGSFLAAQTICPLAGGSQISINCGDLTDRKYEKL
jgi:hypothetical protein